MATFRRILDNNTTNIALSTYLSNSSLQDRFGRVDAVVFARPIHVFELMLVFCIRIKLRLASHNNATLLTSRAQLHGRMMIAFSRFFFITAKKIYEQGKTADENCIKGVCFNASYALHSCSRCHVTVFGRH